MESSTANQLTTSGNQNFFLSPQFPMQRQYEAIRAYLVDEEPQPMLPVASATLPAPSASSAISSAMTP
jgi:hypothetical protein